MIKLLSKSVSDRIAAGEVIERPLSAVKELVENSLDAGASLIVVDIKKGGREYIRVTDDGCGIPDDQVELAFRRHATSKISQAEDLSSIDTLGFRGEALASIAAVSRTEIITKTKDAQTGTRTVIEGGQVLEHGAAGCPDGTTMIMRDIFYNTPARLKFMKSDASESSAVIDFVAQMALAYPDVKIRMVSNGKILFSTQGRGDRKSVIFTLSGSDLDVKLLPLHEKGKGMSIDGYISAPGESRANRRGQIFFVNGRAVSSKMLEGSVDKAYTDRLFHGRHPVIYLFLHVDPKDIDVNIHPNKREIKFSNEKETADFVTDSIKHALNTPESVPDLDAGKKENIFRMNDRKKQKKDSGRDQVDIKNILSTYRREDDRIKEEFRDYQSEYRSEPPAGTSAKNDPASADSKKEAEQNGKDTKKTHAHIEIYMGKNTQDHFDFKQIEVTGSVFGTYITAVDHDNMYMIDQHAAHERIIFEKLIGQYNAKSKIRQAIMIPSTFSTTYAQKETESDWIDTLDNMGFSIEEFGPNIYIIKEIPAFMELSEAERFVNDFLDAASEETDFEDPDQLLKIATMACKKAVKANDHLANEEIEELIADLSKCENPFSCPHGRPTYIKFSKYDIEKRFKRV